MKDFFGQELNVGDKVIYINKRYKIFGTSTIVKMTKKLCHLYNFKKRYPQQLVKYT